MDTTHVLTSRSPSRSDAEFLGFQQTKSGNFIPLFNITAEHHPLKGSTVTEAGLRALNLRIPDTPVRTGREK